VVDLNPGIPFAGTFAEDFDGRAMGPGGSVTGMGLSGNLDQCTAQIGGFVQNTATLGGIDGVAMTLTGGVLSEAGKVNTGLDGSYLFANLCFGNYQVEASTPQWYAPSGSTTTLVTLATGQKNLTTNFLFTSTAIQAAAFSTFSQGGWGAKPSGKNPGKLLADNFGTVYGSGGVVIGVTSSTCAASGPFKITMTTAAAIQAFMPQGGAPAALKNCGVTPKTVLAGQVVALELNVRLSAYNVTRFGLGLLHLASGPLAGKTVNEILALGNSALGGNALPSGMTLPTLNDVITKINENFEAGTTDKGYLVP
jgi:hypothetical protein